MKKKNKPTKEQPRTRLSVSYDRQDIAVAVLFSAGFEPWEVAALLRRSEGIVLYVLRKRVARVWQSTEKANS